MDGYQSVSGGNTRQESVANGLTAIQQAGGCDRVLIHDAARPFLDHEVIDRLLATCTLADGAMPILPTIDTTITQADGFLETTVDRNAIWRVQTPQIFNFGKLVSAHKIWPEQKNATDDAQIFQAAGYPVMTVEGDEKLKKYTTPADFQASGSQMITRTGMGYDVHQLAGGEELWLGGIKIEHEKGLVGHSDADVLLHALTDALLGAIGAGDIGDHFPPSDPQWSGAASDQFVRYAAQLIRERNGQINNVDMTLICEAPKVKPHRQAIRENIAEMLDISLDQVSVKATTTEGLGFTGRREGIAAQAIATVSLE
jgi:2-C-methyl-D-erythritol 4-phosphate cytidylyltransferase/2-C-methyl-D-erythritol 2,4-cyclodiphosphate synthase